MVKVRALAWTKGAVFAGLLAAAMSSAAESSREIEIGIIDNNEPGYRSETVSPTLAYLAQKLPGYRIYIRDIPAYRAVESIRWKRPDFIIGPSDLFYNVSTLFGAQVLALRKNAWAEDGNQSVGSALVVRADREDIETLADLQGLSVAAPLPDSLGGWIAMKGEIRRSGFDPQAFFGRENFLTFQYPDVIQNVLDKKSDAGVLTACQLEILERNGLVQKGLLRVLHDKSANPETAGAVRGLACRTSTDLYPGQVFGVMDFSRPQLIKDTVIALLTMPAQNTFSWQAAGRFNTIADLYRDLEMGPYKRPELTFLVILQKYFLWILGAVGLIAFLVLSEIRLRHLVQKRTADLRASLDENLRLAEKEQVSRERLAVMERNSLVSHMGSMIAHELKQPLAAIRNYCEIARIRLEDLDEPQLEDVNASVSRETERINSIVDRVRGYARKKTAAHVRCDLSDVARRAVDNFKSYEEYRTVHPIVRLQTEPAAYVRGDALELEILLINLMKNASRAMKAELLRQITISVHRRYDTVVLCVSDTGPVLDDAGLERLKHASDSTNAGGLGLGLSIVRGIADSHSAHLSVSRAMPSGVRFDLTFDADDAVPVKGQGTKTDEKVPEKAAADAKNQEPKTTETDSREDRHE